MKKASDNVHRKNSLALKSSHVLLYCLPYQSYLLSLIKYTTMAMLTFTFLNPTICEVSKNSKKKTSKINTHSRSYIPMECRKFFRAIYRNDKKYCLDGNSSLKDEGDISYKYDGVGDRMNDYFSRSFNNFILIVIKCFIGSRKKNGFNMCGGNLNKQHFNDEYIFDHVNKQAVYKEIQKIMAINTFKKVYKVYKKIKKNNNNNECELLERVLDGSFRSNNGPHNEGFFNRYFHRLLYHRLKILHHLSNDSENEYFSNSHNHKLSSLNFKRSKNYGSKTPTKHHKKISRFKKYNNSEKTQLKKEEWVKDGNNEGNNSSTLGSAKDITNYKSNYCNQNGLFRSKSGHSKKFNCEIIDYKTFKTKICKNLDSKLKKKNLRNVFLSKKQMKNETSAKKVKKSNKRIRRRSTKHRDARRIQHYQKSTNLERHIRFSENIKKIKNKKTKKNEFKNSFFHEKDIQKIEILFDENLTPSKNIQRHRVHKYQENNRKQNKNVNLAYNKVNKSKISRKVRNVEGSCGGLNNGSIICIDLVEEMPFPTVVAELLKERNNKGERYWESEIPKMEGDGRITFSQLSESSADKQMFEISQGLFFINTSSFNLQPKVCWFKS